MHPTAPDDTQLAAWKKQHGSVYAIEVEGLTGYVRKPKPVEVKIALAVGAGDAMRTYQNLLENCWLGGASELMKDDPYQLAALEAMSDVADEWLDTYRRGNR